MHSKEVDKNKNIQQLILDGLEQIKKNGQAEPFLLHEYEKRKSSYSKEEFEQIYRDIIFRNKGKPPKKTLFR